jgi:Mn2+/Fe2+ NRAMP family transporter
VGVFVNHPLTTVAAGAVVSVIVGLNVYLFCDTFPG